MQEFMLGGTHFVNKESTSSQHGFKHTRLGSVLGRHLQVPGLCWDGTSKFLVCSGTAPLGSWFVLGRHLQVPGLFWDGTSRFLVCSGTAPLGSWSVLGRHLQVSGPFWDGTSRFLVCTETLEVVNGHIENIPVLSNKTIDSRSPTTFFRRRSVVRTGV